MAVGDNASAAIRSYIAFSKESTEGTYASATTAVEAISCNFRVTRDSMKLETLNKSRDFSKRVQTDKVVEGSLELYCHPLESVLIMASALGGPLLTSSQSGIAIHTLTAGNFDTTTAIRSLSFNVRKGEGTAHTWRYNGGKVNVLTLSGEVGQPIKMSAEFVFRDATLQSDDISANLSVSSIAPFVYHQGQYIYNATQGSLTTTMAEPIQSFEMEINNNIVSDEGARQLGSIVPGVLPATQREIMLTITQRWDTTTNYNRFIEATQGAVRLEFTAATITSTSALQYKWQIDMPKVFMNSPDPELSGAGDILQSEIEFDVVTDDPNTTTGKAIVVTVQNQSTY